MTIKHHIMLSATITVALIAVIACQQKTQAPKEENNLNDKIKTQVTKVEDTAKKAQEAAAKAEAEAKEAAKKAEEEAKAAEAKAKEAAKKLEEEAKAAEAKAKEKIKEVENKVDEAIDETESEIKEGEEAVKKAVSYGPEQLKQGKFNKDLEGWDAYKKTPENAYQVMTEEEVSFVRIDNPEGETYGLSQAVPVTSGAVYRLSAKFRSYETDYEDRSGARLAFYTPGGAEKEVLWNENFKNWKSKGLTFTNHFEGAATVYFHLGNAKSSSSGDVTDISLKPVNND